MKSKVCTKCKEEKNLSFFHKNKHSKDGHAWVCKSCMREYYQIYSKKNRERINAKTREWYKKNERGTLKHHLMKSYNLSLEEYHYLYESQGRKCAVCSIDIFIHTKKNSRHSACVDHCHKTGKVRGLLCNHCNRALGMLKDNKTTIENLLKYIEKYNDK